MISLKNLYRAIKYRGFFVILDARDNSVTLSEKLYRHMDVESKDAAKVIVFRMSDSGLYSFVLNPQLDEPTQLCDIQYNSKHKTIGFETLCPTVGRIFYDYGIRHEGAVKMTVVPRQIKDLTIYEIQHS
jgi:hypothetical protein